MANTKAKTGTKKKIVKKTASPQSKVKGTQSKAKVTKGKKRPKHIILISLLFMMILLAIAGLGFCVYIIVSAPKFTVSELYKSSSSIIYDIDNNVIAELGAEKRDNVTYDELPDVLVDAIVATEDSKYFEHSGIDLLRFGKAVLGQLMGQSDAGGGSTLTMQVVKNTYNGTASHGIKGIIRKFTDIYMAVFKVEKTYTKQEILEFYVNQPYLGGNNTYGVSQASQTYFGKSVGELNLAEAALIAGLFQAPSAYNPFYYPEKAEARRNLVLGLMVRHGYITKEEANVARAIKVKDMLVEMNSNISKYQGFIDTVVEDVIDKTKLNPYSTSMTIYSTMNPKKQDVINKLYDGTLYKWKNEVVQCGIAVTDVDDGSITAIGTGRNKNRELSYNYATMIKRHPGSTAKPIFDYGPAIEYEGWGTGTTVVDEAYTYSDGSPINNVDFVYNGILTAKKALATSRNVPALQAFQATSQEDKYEFVTNLGITPEVHDGIIYESSSIGAFNGVSPLELSAAYGAFARGGYYIEPYSFTKIIYNDTNETYTHTPTKSKAMSEETAYMVNMILKYAVTSGAIGVGSVSGTDVASKTGTTSMDTNLKNQLGLSSSAINDVWQVSYSPDYAIAFWYGYDVPTKKYYLTSDEGWSARRAIVRALTPNILEKNSRWKQPKGVTTVDIELETNPVQLASEFTPDNLRSTEYFRKGTEPTEVSTRFSRLDNVSNLTYTTDGNQIKLSWSEIETPASIDENSLLSYFEKNYERWSEKLLTKRLNYNTENIGTLVYEVFIKNPDGSLSSIGFTSNNSFNTSLTNATNATFVVKSTYTIFKANASTGAEINVKIDTIPGIPDNSESDTENDVTDPGEQDSNESN